MCAWSLLRIAIWRNPFTRGTFREDLFYRLNVFPLRLPPLRERGDDVVRLASAFTRRFAAKMGRTIAPLTADSERLLTSYSWPGNVRELQNVIERAVITAIDGRLNLERALPEASPAHLPTSEDSTPPPAGSGRRRNSNSSNEPIFCARSMPPSGKFPAKRARPRF